MLLFVLFYAVMASVFTFGKEVVLYAEPFFITALRFPLAGLILFLFSFFTSSKIGSRALGFASLLSIYTIAVLCMDSGRLIALKILSAPEGALIAALAPFIGAFMGYFFLHEKISVRKVIALCIGFSGILPGILGSSNVTVSSISASSIIPYLIAFFSVCGAVVSGTVIKLIKKRYQVPMLQTVSMGMMGGGAIAFLLSLYFESWTPVPFINSARALPIIAYLFLFHNLLAYPLYGYLVERYPLTLVSFAQLLIPFFTALFRWLFFSEMVTFSFVISFVILSGALYFFYLEDKKDNKNL